MWRICYAILFFTVYQLVDGVPLNFHNFRISPSLISSSPNATHTFSFKTSGISSPSVKNKITDKEPDKSRINENEIYREINGAFDESHESSSAESGQRSSMERIDFFRNNKTQKSRRGIISTINISQEPETFSSQRMLHDKYMPTNTKNYTHNSIKSSTTAKYSSSEMEKSHHRLVPDFSSKSISSLLKFNSRHLDPPTLESHLDQNATTKDTETSYQIKGKMTQERERINKLKRETPSGNRKLSFNVGNTDLERRPKSGTNNTPSESKEVAGTGTRDEKQIKVREVQMEKENHVMVNGEAVVPLHMTEREQKLHEMTEELVLDLRGIEQSEEFYPISQQTKRQHVLEMLEMHLKGIGSKKKLKKENEQKTTVIDDTSSEEEEEEHKVHPAYESTLPTEGPQEEKDSESSGEIVTSQYPSYIYNELSMIQDKYQNMVHHFLSQMGKKENEDSAFPDEAVPESEEQPSSESEYEYIRKFRSFKGPFGRPSIYDLL